jgi:hypothetical protein
VTKYKWPKSGISGIVMRGKWLSRLSTRREVKLQEGECRRERRVMGQELIIRGSEFYLD